MTVGKKNCGTLPNLSTKIRIDFQLYPLKNDILNKILQILTIYLFYDRKRFKKQ